MNKPNAGWLSQIAKEFFETLWPAVLPADSEFQRRRKLAVRSAQVAALALIAMAVMAAIATQFAELSPARVAGVIVIALACIAWNVLGTREVVRTFLWEPGDGTAPKLIQRRDGSTVAYFAVQLGLVSIIYNLLEPGSKMGLLWLILLPPVAHSVLLLQPRGICLVSSATVALFAFYLVRWHGWDMLPNALLAFGFAVLFTLVFTLLAAASEKARGEVQRLACELSDANRKLREYAIQAEELAVTRERNRLAREIHDTLGHYLTVVNVQIEAARVMVERDPACARDALNKAQLLTQEGLQDIRRSVSSLRSSPLDCKSLEQALQQVVESVRQSGLAAEMNVVGTSRPLSRPVELTLFRAAQEGLTNVQKHAKARRATLVLDFSMADKVRLTVVDDGVGSSSEPGSGFGLMGLRERAHIVGGIVEIKTAPTAGFSLHLEVPA